MKSTKPNLKRMDNVVESVDEAIIFHRTHPHPRRTNHDRRRIGLGTRLFKGVLQLKLEPIEVNGISLTTHIKYNILK